MNIYEKMAEIMKEVQYVNKDDHVKYKEVNYKGLSEEKITKMMREQFVKQGLVVFPVEQVWNRQGSITHVDVKYRIVNVENPEEFIEVVSCGDGADSQDKGSGKAMTYAYKYMWLRTFGIPTGEDPDKISSQQLDDEEAARQKSESKASMVAKLKLEMERTGISIASLLGTFRIGVDKEASVEQNLAKLVDSNNYDEAMRKFSKQPTKSGDAA